MKIRSEEIGLGAKAPPKNAKAKTLKASNDSINRWIKVGLIKEKEDIPKKYKKIIEFIETGKVNDKQYTKYADNSKKTHLNSLKKVLQEYQKKYKIKQSEIEKISDRTTELDKGVQQQVKENKQTNEKRKGITYEQLNEVRKELLKDFKEGMDKKKHIKIIILSCILLQPPIRSQIASMDIIRPNQKPKKIDNKHYLIIHSDKKWKTVVNEIIKNHRKLDKNQKNSPEEYEGFEIELSKDLTKFITQSLKIWKRRFLIPNIDGTKPLPYATMYSYMKEIHPSLSIDTARSVYNTWFQSTKQRKYVELEKLADNMMTSVKQLQTTYLKLSEDDDSDDDSDDSDDDNDPCEGVEVAYKSNKELPELIESKKKCNITEDRKKYYKEWAEKNKQRKKINDANHYQENKYNIDRRKAISRAKSGKKLTQRTMEKYNIIPDDLI